MEEQVYNVLNYIFSFGFLIFACWKPIKYIRNDFKRVNSKTK